MVMDNLIQGTRRERVDVDELRRLKKAGAVFLDPRRTRPLWFDGRFLKAHDLNREQNYFLTRQADLAVATGTGIIEGLRVEAGTTATAIVIREGHGVTHGGERVLIARDLVVDLANIPIIQRLNVALGLSRIPAPPLRSRSGLYIVVLRPLEFTANPIASYPTHIDEQRSLEDGEIIEATAVTLVPYALSGNLIDAGQRRAQAADQIFVSGSEVNVPSSSLPLAMIELERGNVRWIDNDMVSRDMGTTYSDVLGFGLAPRPLRQAHYKQYQAMLSDVLDERRSLNSSLRFAATEHFISLPPAGQMPAAGVDMATGTQVFFPAAMNVELSLVPEDEIATLVEESMLLPPIDLTANEATLETTSVLILVPVQRHRHASRTRALTSRPVALKPSVNLTRTHLKPIDLVRGLRTKLPVFTPPAIRPTVDLSEATWRSLVAEHTLLWYIRRRNLSYKDEIVGEAEVVETDELRDETAMRSRLEAINLDRRFTNLKIRGSAAADLAMVNLLASPKFSDSPTLTRAAVAELEAAEKLDESAALRVTDRFAEPDIAVSINKLESAILEPDKRADGSTIKAAADRNTARTTRLTETLKLPETDEIVRKLSDEEFEEFAVELKTVLDDKQKTPQNVAELISKKHRSLTP
jgi:hypothetical protein